MKGKLDKREWYIEGEKEGRTTAELKDMIDSGHLSAKTKVKWVGDDRWLERPEVKLKIAELMKGRGRMDRRADK